MTLRSRIYTRAALPVGVRGAERWARARLRHETDVRALALGRPHIHAHRDEFSLIRRRFHSFEPPFDQINPNSGDGPSPTRGRLRARPK